METRDLIDENDCCGCKLCKEKCPKGAIIMHEKELGIEYPEINEMRCIDCNICQKNCPVQKRLENETIKVYAAVNRNKNQLISSSSGGVFSAIAMNVLASGGIVYGAAFVQDSEKILTVQHIRISEADKLSLIQGSKYLQSDMEDVYQKIAEDLKNGEKILFSGTPCQVASIKSLFGNHENLILVDIICHGTPAPKLFSEYLKVLQAKNKGKYIKSFQFRSKESGWGLCAKIVLQDDKGNEESRRIPCNISSYYKMFLKGETYRKACYRCKYAKKERIGDLTLGDYWGVEKDFNTFEQLRINGFEITEGVSCVIVSTEKGEKLLHSSDVFFTETTFNDVTRENNQLLHPTRYPDSRNDIEKEYRKNGYIGLEKRFQRELGIQKYLIMVRNYIPPKVRMKLRMMLKK